jgi:NAD(P)-dependent dehydrogenase (short-subunit alcohol dehydrogenase family)
MTTTTATTVDVAGLLEGRVAIVSGIGPGMGRDISLTLARAGADVVLAARRDETMRAVAEEVEALGRRAVCVATDVTDRSQCDRLVAAATDLGPLRVLVNNAFAEEGYDTFSGFDPERWRAPMEVNVFGTLQLCQAAVPHLRAAGGGSIVNITTLSIHMVNPVLAGYAASKRALTVATKVLARELGRDGIRVNCVAPGHIWGQSLEGYFAWQASRRGVSPQQVYDEVAGMTALGHIPTSEEISRAVLFFASNLSSMVTGQTLDVNCGRYMD